jgi:predicted O-methyltransferase YrrM
LHYEDVSKYVENFVGNSGVLFTWALEKSCKLEAEGVMPIDPPRGRFLELIARMTRPRRILEVGSGVGYSALWLLKGSGKRTRLDVMEINPIVTRAFEQVMKKAGYWKRVRAYSGPALEVLPRLKGLYDLAFIDADKDEYPDYLQHGQPMEPGAADLCARVRRRDE